MKQLARILLMMLVWSVANSADAILRDPTRPPNDQVTTGISERQLIVNAILLSTDRQLAIVNGAIFKVGDTIAGNKITAITANSVQLVDENGKVSRLFVTEPVKRNINKPFDDGK